MISIPVCDVNVANHKHLSMVVTQLFKLVLLISVSSLIQGSFSLMLVVKCLTCSILSSDLYSRTCIERPLI